MRELRKLIDGWSHRFSRRRGRGATPVGHHVADAGIGLVTNARDNRNRARRHKASQRLVVEGHEVLERAAAAHQQDGVGTRVRGNLQGTHDGGRSPRPLHLAAHHLKLYQRIPARKGALHVIDDAARERGDHGHARAEARDGPLAGLVHQSFGLQLTCQCGDLLTKQALARGLEFAGDKRHAAAAGIDIKAAGQLHRQAVAQLKPAFGVRAAPDDDVHRRLVILHLEIAVARARVGAAKARDLARHHHERKRPKAELCVLQRPGNRDGRVFLRHASSPNDGSCG